MPRKPVRKVPSEHPHPERKPGKYRIRHEDLAQHMESPYPPARYRRLNPHLRPEEMDDWWQHLAETGYQKRKFPIRVYRSKKYRPLRSREYNEEAQIKLAQFRSSAIDRLVDQINVARTGVEKAREGTLRLPPLRRIRDRADAFNWYLEHYFQNQQLYNMYEAIGKLLGRLASIQYDMDAEKSNKDLSDTMRYIRINNQNKEAARMGVEKALEAVGQITVRTKEIKTALDTLQTAIRYFDQLSKRHTEESIAGNIKPETELDLKRARLMVNQYYLRVVTEQIKALMQYGTTHTSHNLDELRKEAQTLRLRIASQKRNLGENGGTLPESL